MTDLVFVLRQFLLSYCPSKRPLLLALSGGADSFCLLNCLLSCQELGLCSFHIAHVDHGWRTESRQEADVLEDLANQLHIPFYLKRLDPSLLQGNLEQAFREQRYQFFKEVCLEKDLEGVVLGHHQDDQAETVLKRVLEGAHWSKLAALAPVSMQGSMRLLRPFLSVSKKEIYKWLQEKKLSFFHDSTNDDPRYLRARMRMRLLPELNRMFGKEVQRPLQMLATEMQDLKEYFDKKIEPILKQKIKGPFGSYVDIEALSLSTIEIKYLIRKISEDEGMGLSKQQVEQAAEWLQQGAANHQLSFGHRTVWIDRYKLFFLKENIPGFTGNLSVYPGSYLLGKWQVEIKEVKNPDLYPTGSWKDCWKGECSVVLPIDKDLKIEPALTNASYLIKNYKMNKWWANHKVPAFLRSIFPVIWKDNTVYHEFLTGQRAKWTSADQNWVAIKLSFPLY